MNDGNYFLIQEHYRQQERRRDAQKKLEQISNKTEAGQKVIV